MNVGNFHKPIAGALCAVALAGCAGFGEKVDVRPIAETTKRGPEGTPEVSITNFSDALRCMDEKLLSWGIRDVHVLADDLDDKTKKVAAGTKDMLISAISNMTRRSRAIQLNTFGQDTKALTEFILRGQTLAPFGEQPQFAIRGSVSQFDQNIVRRERDLGVGYNDKWSVGLSENAGVSRLAVDLNMIFGSNFAIVPGVTSQNSILVFNQGRGADGDAQVRKFGITFNLSISRTDGLAHALRNLIDLSAIELIGRVTRTPYWRCLSARSDQAEIKREVEDWFQSARTSGDLTQYVQFQLRERGYYAGQVDGKISAEFNQAVASYRVAMRVGASGDPGTVDLEFFRAYLDADHAIVWLENPLPTLPTLRTIPPKPAAVAPMTPAEPQSVTVSPPAIPALVAGRPTAERPAASLGGPTAAGPERLRVSVDSLGGGVVFGRGEDVEIVVYPNRTAYVHCFRRDDQRQVRRIFPHQGQQNALIRGGESITLPGSGPFRLTASARGITEAIVCYATDREVLTTLPQRFRAPAFQALPVSSVEELKQAFRHASNDMFAEGVFYVRTQ